VNGKLRIKKESLKHGCVEMSERDKQRAKHSLFWYGDLRECPELEGSEAEREAKEELEYWGLLIKNAEKKDRRL